MAPRLAFNLVLLGFACTPTAPSGAKVEAPREEPVRDGDAAAGEERQEEPEACPPAVEHSGFENCRAVELTGAAPCEAICTQTREAPANDCCEQPVDAVVFSDTRELLRVAACSFVPPECADTHGHGNMDATLRVLEGPPVELIVVEGGCEMRASMHGYVPAGVAAWTGCEHERYRWDGERLVEQ